MSIRYQIDHDLPVPFAVMVYGEHLKMVKNPRLFGAVPQWLQETMANDVLRKARPMPPEHVQRRAAEVIQIETLREQREVRAANEQGRSSSV